MQDRFEHSWPAVAETKGGNSWSEDEYVWLIEHPSLIPRFSFEGDGSCPFVDQPLDV